MRGHVSKGFIQPTLPDPFYTKVTQAQVASDAQAEADAARELSQGRASQALQDQADALREDLESKGE